MNIPGRDATPAPARLSHDAAEALISDRLDGPLDPVANRSLLAHLATCSSCRAFAEQMSGMSRGFRDLPHLPPSPAVSRQVRERLQAGQPWWSRLSMGGGERFGAMQAAAALLILVGAVATVLIVQMIGRDGGTGDNPTLTPPTVTTLTVQPNEVADASPSATRTPGDAAFLTPRATNTPRPDPTRTPINVQIDIPTATETTAATEAPSATATDEPEPTATETATEEPSATPTDEPTNTPRPTRTPTDEPTETPTDEPTAAPTETEEPTETPTDEPTETPTDEPTETPTDEPTSTPTDEPTSTPTDEPTETPTDEPTATEEPTETPRPTQTPSPTEDPTQTVEPTLTGTPRILPRTPASGQGGDNSPQETVEPTDEPTDEPTEEPTDEPTEEPATEEPTEETGQPTIAPTGPDDATATPESIDITSTGPTEGTDSNSTGGEEPDDNGSDNNGTDGNGTDNGGTDDGNGTGIGAAGNETSGETDEPTPTENGSTAEGDSSYEQADVLGEFPQAIGATTGLSFSARDLFVYSDGSTISIGDSDGSPIASFAGSNPVWSPQGGVLLYQVGGELGIWDADTYGLSSITEQTRGDQDIYDIPAGWNGPQLLYIRRFTNEPGRAEFHTADWNGANDFVIWDGQLSDILAQPVATTDGVWILTSDGWVQLFYEGGAGDPRPNPWGSISDPVASPFGSVFAFVTGDGQLMVVTASNPELPFSAPIPDGGAGFAFSPDGASLVVANGNGLTTYDMASGTQIGQLEGEAVAAPGWGNAGIYAVTQGQVPLLIRLPNGSV